MDSSRFTKPSGELVQINARGDIAFIPSPLPRGFEVPASLAPLWADAREIIGELRGIGKILPDHALLTRPLRQREALRSSSLEGTYATPAELLAYERDPRDPNSSSDPVNSWKEVHNYQSALDLGQRLVTEGYPFSEWLIRQLHETLLGGVRGADKSPGQIRTNQVHIGAGNRFTPPPQEHLTGLMGQLERDIKDDDGTDALIKAFMVHYQFEAIHPFRDGNGRVGRLLLALMIYKCCGFDMPWLYLSEFFERNKDEYIDNLFNVSSESAWLAWVRFCLLATVDVGKSTVSRVQSLIALKQTYEEKIKAMNGRDRLIHMVPCLFKSPIVKYRDLQNELNISYPTARDDIEAMINADILANLEPAGNPRTFYAPEIFGIAYGD